MGDYVISCCSTADLTTEHFEKRDIHYICFHYFLDDREIADDLGQTIPFPEFYKSMQEGPRPGHRRSISMSMRSILKLFSRMVRIFSMSACPPEFRETSIPPAMRRPIFRKNIRIERSIFWIPWERRPAMGC